MLIGAQLQTDMVTAMKAKEEERLGTIRMMRSALKNKEIDKRSPLTEPEEQAVLQTMIKQRRESIEQFTKGNRPELAAKEQAEIVVIEAYLPQAAGEDEVRRIVVAAIEHMTKDGARPGPKEMGTAMKIVRARLLADGIRAEGGMVSELVKAELAKGA